MFFLVAVWNSRFGRLTGEVHRLKREVQTAELATRVAVGELTAAEGERISMLLDLERLGLSAPTTRPGCMQLDVGWRRVWATPEPSRGRSDEC